MEEASREERNLVAGDHYSGIALRLISLALRRNCSLASAPSQTLAAAPIEPAASEMIALGAVRLHARKLACGRRSRRRRRPVFAAGEEAFSGALALQASERSGSA